MFDSRRDYVRRVRLNQVRTHVLDVRVTGWIMRRTWFRFSLGVIPPFLSRFFFLPFNHSCRALYLFDIFLDATQRGRIYVIALVQW